jgi:uncharacterized protein (TIGR03437 family)
MRRFLFVLAFAAGPSAAVAQPPLISARGIVNAASFTPAGLAAGSIARGSLFSIFGARIGPGASPSLAFPLSTTLGGVSIQVTQGTTTAAAIPVFVSPNQINAIMPSNAPLGAVSIYVTVANQKSPPNPARIVTDSFGIFAINSGGSGPGVMQNFVSPTSLPINSTAAAAQPGQTIILYGTGLGAGLNADNVAPASGSLPTKVEVFVGGQLAATSYSGRSPCCSGLDQIAFTVPVGAPPGCWVPVQIRTSGVTVSNTATMAISPDGARCSDSINALSAPFLGGQKTGLIALLRTDVIEDVGTQLPNQPAPNVTTDSAIMTFQQENATPFTFNPVFSLPPPGSCTAYTASGDLFDGDPLPGALTSGKFLNAGAQLTLTNATGTRTVKRPTSNTRNAQPLGYTYTGSLVPSSLFLTPGAFTMSGPGGVDVGSFQAQVTLPSPLAWSNRAQTITIARSQGFTVNWNGAPDGQSVIIFGGVVDLPTNSSAIFACVASPGASSFAVPAAILGNVPVTRVNLLQSKGVIYVGSLPVQTPATFNASGIDFGAIVAGAFFGKTVIFQ